MPQDNACRWAISVGGCGQRDVALFSPFGTTLAMVSTLPRIAKRVLTYRSNNPGVEFLNLITVQF